MKKGKTVSIAGSQQKQKIELGQTAHEIAYWYYIMYNNRTKLNKAPSTLPHYKQSYPYCMTISKINGLTINKKSSQNMVFLNLSGMFVTESFKTIGVPFNYQCQESLGRNEVKWDRPINFYFHSRVEKNSQEIYLIMKVRLIQFKESLVEHIHEIGTMVIKGPFLEQENKNVFIYKQMNEVEFGYLPLLSKNKFLTTNSSSSMTYTIESVLELKKLSKLIPENTIFSYQDPVSGVRGGYLPRQISEERVIKQATAIQVTITYLVIHVSQKFEQDLQLYFTRNFPQQKSFNIKSRKMVVGYHNEYGLVNSNIRKLQLLDKYSGSNNAVISILQNLKEGEVIKLPFYVDRGGCCGVIVVGVIYEINDREIEVASYYVVPHEKGQDIDEEMFVGTGYGAMYQMTPVSKEKPTIMMEYECDLSKTQNDIYEGQNLQGSRELKSRQIFDDEALNKEKQKLREENQRIKAQLQLEKQEMEKLKDKNYMQFQTEFQKKFETQKQNLYKRQQMIFNQHKEQLERQMKEKNDLEEQIRKMSQKLKNIEDEHYKKTSGQFSPPVEEEHPSSPRFRQKQEQFVQGGMMGRQRMDPGYIIQPQNPVPVKKVRQIIEKGPKVTSQILKQSEQQFNYASKFSFTFISIIWSNSITPPKNIYFVFRFFNQQEFTSDSISYIQSGQGNYNQLIRTAHFNHGYESKEPTYSFIIDPSEYHEPHMLQKDLTRYLAHNAAIVDVFCGESHIYIGQINIKLKEVIRGNKNQIMTAKELNLVRLKDKQNLGMIQLLVKNQQTNCKEMISVKQHKKVRDLRKKVVSNNPIVISQEQKMMASTEDIHRGQTIKTKSNIASRQELRIQKFKEQRAQKTFTQTANGFDHLGQGQKQTILGQIINYKEKKMNDYLKRVYADQLNEQINLSAHFGKAVTFPYLFQNTSQSPSSYRIQIMQVGKEDSKQLSVVKGSKEWRYFVAEHNYSEPKRYDMIGESNKFFLHPGESIPLIFKFLSFQKNKEKDHSKQKIVNVTICKEDNNWIAGGFSLLAQMHQPIIHHSYILYEPGEQMVDIIVPVIYSQTENTSNPKRLYITDSNPHSTAQWLNPYEILLRVETPKIMQKVKFNLLLYNDEYFCDLTQNWLIQIYAYEGVCSYFRSDFNTKFKITMPWSSVPAHLGMLSLDRIGSSLKLFASSASLVFTNNIIEVESDRRDEGGCEIWCELLGGENTRKNAEITCVSGDYNELIYGWTVTVYPYVSRY